MNEEIKIYQDSAYSTLKKILSQLRTFPDLPSAIVFLELTLKKMREISTRDLDQDSKKYD